MVPLISLEEGFALKTYISYVTSSYLVRYITNSMYYSGGSTTDAHHRRDGHEKGTVAKS